MRQTAVGIFSGKDLTLDGVFAAPEGINSKIPAILVCHPHPTLGADMDNPVVTAICGAAAEAGLASLRFNFRGVGGSEGTFSNGEEEGDDVRAALGFLSHMRGVQGKRLGVVGYSFGAAMILGAMSKLGLARSFALVAPPVSSVRESRIQKDKRPKLFLTGSKDGVVRSVDLQRTLDDVRQPVQFFELPDADHRLHGQEADVAERTVEFMLETL